MLEQTLLGWGGVSRSGCSQLTHEAARPVPASILSGTGNIICITGGHGFTSHPAEGELVVSLHTLKQPPDLDQVMETNGELGRK